MPAPKIDKRTYEQIVAQVEALAETLTTAVPPTVETGWHHSDSEVVKMDDVSVETLTGRVLAADVIETANGNEKPEIIPTGAILEAELIQRLCQIEALGQVKVIKHPLPPPRDAGGALIRIFGRFMELVVDRLNRVPEKNYLAFLNLIGVDLLPPQPARVPLTFYLATNSPVDAVVPVGTQVAAPPAAGEEEEVIFETDQELVVSRAQLKAVLVREPGEERYGDYTERALGDTDEAFPAFSGDQPIEHSLYLARDDFFALPVPKTITLTFDTSDVSRLEELPLTWSYWDGVTWATLSSVQKEVKDGRWIVTIEDLPVPVSRQINGRQEAAWLRARLNPPLPSKLPEIKKITASVNLARAHLAPDLAFANSLLLDLSKDFYPFGEQPRFNDTFYLASQEVFNKPGAEVTVQLTLSDPALIESSSDLDIAWEFWNGDGWASLEVSEPKGDVGKFTKSGTVSFALQETIGPRTVNGETSYWIRARILKGNYGTRASTTQDTDADGKPKYDQNDHPIYKFIPASFRPPSVESLSLAYTYKSEGPLTACKIYNDFIHEDHTQTAAEANDPAFTPFKPSTDTQPALYLGFDQPFANQPVSLYVQVEPPQAKEVSPASLAATTNTTRPQVTWEYANPDGGWTSVGALDETQGFASRGLIRFIGPRDFARRQLFGRELYWVRAWWEKGEFAVPPRLRRLLLNTTWAGQARTIEDETLGSSSGNPGQVFQLAQVPVLPGLCLEVREPGMPSPEEEAEIMKLEGPDAITTILDAAGHPEEIWVRWHAVPDFHGSGPRDRHYTIDYLTGTVRFGDGRYGLIPPPGQNNIRAARYRSGGGAGGNRPRETVIQLKSSVPYIDRVTNFEEASGGADRQSLDRVKRYGPRQLRHRGRAVTVEDFEDLVYAASADVARAKAIPTFSDDGTQPGVIGLIVVPQSDTPQPIPSLGLLEQVKAYLQTRCPATAELWVAGPVWVEVKVTTDVVPASLDVADQVEIQIKAALERFLHPLTGGPLGKGWPFGRLPHHSDLYALVESVEGVDHVRTLTVTVDPTPDKTGPFLIYSGQHQITLGDGVERS